MSIYSRRAKNTAIGNPSEPGSEDWFRQKEQAQEVDDLFGIGGGALGAAKAISFLGGFRPGSSDTADSWYGGRINIDPDSSWADYIQGDDLSYPYSTHYISPQHGFDPSNPQQGLTGALHNIPSLEGGDMVNSLPDNWQPEYVADHLADEPIVNRQGWPDTIVPEQPLGLITGNVFAQPPLGGMNTTNIDNNWASNHPRLGNPFYQGAQQFFDPRNAYGWNLSGSGGNSVPAPPPGGNLGGGNFAGGGPSWPLPDNITFSDPGGIDSGSGGNISRAVELSQYGNPATAAWDFGHKAMDAGAPMDPAEITFEPAVLQSSDAAGNLTTRPDAEIAPPGPLGQIRQSAYADLKTQIDSAISVNDTSALTELRARLEGKFADEMWFRIQNRQPFWEVYEDIYNRSAQLNGNRVARMIGPNELKQALTEFNSATGGVEEHIGKQSLADLQSGTMGRLGQLINSSGGGIFHTYLQKSGMFGPSTGVQGVDWDVNPQGRLVDMAGAPFMHAGGPPSVGPQPAHMWPGAGQVGFRSQSGMPNPLALTVDDIPYWAQGNQPFGTGGLVGTSALLGGRATIPQSVVDIGLHGIPPHRAGDPGAMERLFRATHGLTVADTGQISQLLGQEGPPNITAGRLYDATSMGFDPEVWKMLFERGMLGTKSAGHKLWGAVNPDAPPDPWDAKIEPWEQRLQFPEGTGQPHPEELRKFKEWYRTEVRATHPDRVAHMDVSERRKAELHERYLRATKALARFEKGNISMADAIRNPAAPSGVAAATTLAATESAAAANAAVQRFYLPGYGDGGGGLGRMPPSATQNRLTKLIQKATPTGMGGFLLTAAIFEGMQGARAEMDKSGGEMQSLGVRDLDQVHQSMREWAFSAAQGNLDDSFRLVQLLVDQAGMVEYDENGKPNYDKAVEAANGLIESSMDSRNIDPIKIFNDKYNTNEELANQHPLLKALYHAPFFGNLSHGFTDRKTGVGGLMSNPESYLKHSPFGPFTKGMTHLTSPLVDTLASLMGLPAGVDPFAHYNANLGFGSHIVKGDVSRVVDENKRIKNDRFAKSHAQQIDAGKQAALSNAARRLFNYRGIDYRGNDDTGMGQGHFMNFLMGRQGEDGNWIPGLGAKFTSSPGTHNPWMSPEAGGSAGLVRYPKGFDKDAVDAGVSEQTYPWGFNSLFGGKYTGRTGYNMLQQFGPQVYDERSGKMVRAPGIYFGESVNDVGNWLVSGLAHGERAPGERGTRRRFIEGHSDHGLTSEAPFSYTPWNVKYANEATGYGGQAYQSNLDRVTGEAGYKSAKNVSASKQYDHKAFIDVPNLAYDFDRNNQVTKEELAKAAEMGNPHGPPFKSWPIGPNPTKPGEDRPSHSIFQLEVQLMRDMAKRDEIHGDNVEEGSLWTDKMEADYQKLLKHREKGSTYTRDPLSLGMQGRGEPKFEAKQREFYEEIWNRYLKAGIEIPDRFKYWQWVDPKYKGTTEFERREAIDNVIDERAGFKAQPPKKKRIKRLSRPKGHSSSDTYINAPVLGR